MNVNNLRKTTSDDVKFIANNLRYADKNEIYASSGNYLYYSRLIESYDLSNKCYTWTINGLPAMIVGICDDNKGGGIIWAMGTDEITKERKFFLKESVKIIEEFKKDYEKIYNYVYSKNYLHIEWLKRVGFNVGGDVIELHNNEEFIYFEMEK